MNWIEDDKYDDLITGRNRCMDTQSYDRFIEEEEHNNRVYMSDCPG